MRAMVLHQLGGPVTSKEVDSPRLSPCEAMVRVRAAGVGLTIITPLPPLGVKYPF